MNEDGTAITDILSWNADTNRTNRNYMTEAVNGFKSRIAASRDVTASSQIDVISGATCSSWGIRDAMQSILGK